MLNAERLKLNANSRMFSTLYYSLRTQIVRLYLAFSVLRLAFSFYLCFGANLNFFFNGFQ
jgi:hypothetical protein